MDLGINLDLGGAGVLGAPIGASSNPLTDAVLWLDAGLSPISGGKLLNLGTGGSALDATFGSTTGTDTNDPLKLDHSGTNYLYLPGAAGNYISSPDSNALDVTGDLELVIRANASTWGNAAFQTLINKRIAAPDQSYSLRLQGTATIDLVLSADGTALGTASSTVAFPGANGTTYWIKVTYRASDRRVQFFYAPDQATEPTSFTQIGADVTHPTAAIFASAAPLEIGSRLGGTVDLFGGGIYRAIVRNGIGGTTVFDADFTRGITSGAQTTFTESSANAATVTINRATAGRKSVAVVQPTLLFGTDDYLEVADNALLNFALTDDFTVLAVFREFGTVPAFARYVSKRDSSTGWELLHNNSLAGRGYLFINDGTVTVDTAVNAGTYTQGSLSMLTGVRDVTADKLRTYANAVATGADLTDNTTASLSNALALRIGRQGGVSTSYGDFEFIAAAVFRRALTAAEIATLTTRYSI